MNRLTDAGVLSEDKLFATLDPTTRKFELPSGEYILLTDTVGFIRKLPHHLVKAFKSTLDEVVYADILILVSDINDPEAPEHIEVTKGVIDELGASDKPIIYVYNKCDLLDGDIPQSEDPNTVIVSGATGFGMDDLLNSITREIQKCKKEYDLLIPYTDQGKLSAIYNVYTVKCVDYVEDGVSVKVVLDSRGRGLYEKYIVNNG